MGALSEKYSQHEVDETMHSIKLNSTLFRVSILQLWCIKTIVKKLTKSRQIEFNTMHSFACFDWTLFCFQCVEGSNRKAEGGRGCSQMSGIR